MQKLNLKKLKKYKEEHLMTWKNPGELVKDEETDLPKCTGNIQENGQFSDVDAKILSGGDT